MRRLTRGFAKRINKRMNTIYGRLLPIFLFSLLGLLLIVSLVYYQRATEQVRDQVGTLAEKNMSQTVALFDQLLDGYDSVTKTLNSNGELMRLLRRPLSPVWTIEEAQSEKRITDILGAIFYSRRDILGIHVLANKGKVYSFERASGATQHVYPDEPWFKQLERSKGEIRWLGVYKESLMSGETDRPVFAFGRQVFELEGLKSVGYVLIEVEADAITSAVSNASLGAGSQVVIRDAAGVDVIRTGSQQEAWTSVPPGWPGELKAGEIRAYEGGDWLLTAAQVEKTGWTILRATPQSDLKLELKETQQFLLTVIFALIIAATALSTIVSRSFSLPFKRLAQQMKQVETGNFQGQVHIQSYEEINMLVGSFNRMVREMDVLVERIKQASISEKNAQLQALQSQINPHFLFNTLDMIYWMLDEREDDRLEGVILALSKMFRYSSDWEEGARVRLRLELEQLKSYLTIIETRLGRRVQTEIEVEERWLDAPVPKMILQPIVENAVKYGLEPLRGGGTLHIYSESDEHSLRIVVEDNGSGMTGDTLVRLRRLLSDPPAGDVHEAGGRIGIGLLNVQRRIRLMYGEAYGLTIESATGTGTKVSVAFPVPDEEESLL
ncbi:sensor histidine kinase [Saccharibacillus sp. CPCC 101409]|uniref:cache domain-containing sensor histidine kinase n=1 Tax=Saccharibacillus sp. CPCC 101409 TaxID=3058041 RepID=UPI0026736DFC|nr:sensor histidine kinase [Saccharibacillus sp. CPCC 101409]MDO3410360.1 sensor histidine kinase [Saccharibacillus sp. CPCC 101409]